MIQSMTGYGKAELNLTNANFTIEVRSLNSKQIDANVKMSSIYRDKEIGLRKLLSEKLKIDSLIKQTSIEYAKQSFFIKDTLGLTFSKNKLLNLKKFDEIWTQAKTIAKLKHKKIEELTFLKSAILAQELQSEAA